MNKKVTLSLLSATVFASMAASAFAAPTQGVYMGGSVDKFYKLDDLFQLTPEANKQFIANLNATDYSNLVFVDFDGKGAKFSEVFAAGTLAKAKRDLTKADFEGSYVTVNTDGTDGASYDPRNDAVDGAPGELKVESVSAINLNQIKVTFNQKVDETSATTLTNYDVRQNGAGTSQLAATGGAPDDVVELQEDGKSVIINLDESADLTKNAAVYVKVSGVKTEDGKGTVAAFETTFLANDTAAPAATTAKVNAGSNGFVVSFDEPIDFTTAVAKVNGVPATIGAGPDKYSVNVTASLTAGQTYSVYVSGVKDLAGNAAASVTKSVTHTLDTVAPTLQAVTQKDDLTMKFTFSEALGAAPTVKVSRGTTIFANATPTVDATDTTGKTYLLTLSSQVGGVDLYPAGQTSTTVVTEIGSFKDASNNVAAGSTQNVTLSRNVVAPVVVEKVWDTANTNVVVKFDKNLATALDAGKILVTDETGADVTSSVTAVVDPDGLPGTNGTGKYIIFDGLAASKKYTFNLLAGYAKDTAVVPNYNAAYTFTIDTTPTTTDVQAPSLEANAGVIAAETKLAGGTNPDVAATGNVIRILLDEEVTAAANNTSNYKLDGAALPAGSVVVLEKDTANNQNRIVKITLPTGSVQYDGAYELTISGLKDAAGNTMTTKTVPVTLHDTVKPVLQSAKIDATTGAVLLTFDEAIKSTTATDENDFIVTVNGVQLATTQFTVGDDAVANDKVIKLTFSGVNTVGQNVTVATAGTVTTLTDNSGLGNTAKAGVSVTATN